LDRKERETAETDCSEQDVGADTGFVVPTEKSVLYKAKYMMKKVPWSEDLISYVTYIRYRITESQDGGGWKGPLWVI